MNFLTGRWDRPGTWLRDQLQVSDPNNERADDTGNLCSLHGFKSDGRGGGALGVKRQEKLRPLKSQDPIQIKITGNRSA